MGHELYRMILDGAPASWTAPMRLVAGVIADDARDPSQGPPGDGGWPRSAIPVRGSHRKGEWRDGLTERTGMSERAISRALSDLARAGYEMREQVDTDKRGRPVFAYPGHATRFRVPLLAPRPCPPSTATISPPSTAAITEAGMVARSGNDGRRIRRASRRSPNSAGPSPHTSPLSPQRLNRSVVNSSLEGVRDGQGDDDSETQRRQQQDALKPDPRVILAGLGATETETDFIITKTEADPGIPDTAAWLLDRIGEGKGNQVVAQARRASPGRKTTDGGSAKRQQDELRRQQDGLTEWMRQHPEHADTPPPADPDWEVPF